MIQRRLVVTALSVAALGLGAFTPAHASHAARPDGPVDVQLVSITDLHGYLQPPSPADGGTIRDSSGKTLTVGGAAYIATHVKQIRQGHANSILFADGDNFSGWPFEVDAYQDEPTIEFLNSLGIQFSSVGNHELDKSPSFLVQHMEHGKCFGTIGVDSCFTDSTGKRFHGADFSYYSSNIVDEKNKTIVPPYHVENVKGPNGKTYKIGFIGATVADTPVGPSSYQPDLKALDIATTVNKYAAELTQRGVQAIVLNMHEGATDDAPGFNDCKTPHGPAVDIAKQISPAVDVIVTGHWHAAFNCMINDPAGNARPVVEAANHGRLISEINLKLDPNTGDVIRGLTTSVNHAVTRDVAPDPATQKIVDYWRTKGTELYAEPLATQTGDFTKAPNDAGESTLGDLYADAELWDANRTSAGAADLALISPKPPMRATPVHGDLLVADSGKPGDANGRILFGEAWDAFGYGDPVLTVSLTGEQLHTILEEQWQTQANGTVKFSPFAVSANTSITWDPTKAVGSKIDPSDVIINGKPLDVAATYRVAVLAFTVIGRDGYAGFAAATDPVRDDADHELFVAYLRAHPTITPGPLDRVQIAE